MKLYIIFAAIFSMLMAGDVFALTVTAKKIQLISRSADIEKEIEPFLSAKSDKHWEAPGVLLMENARFEAKSKRFKIESTAEESEGGDLARYSFFLIKNDKKKQPLADSPMSSVVVLPGEKFLILEPLVIVDTDKWIKTDLAKEANLSPYFSLLRFCSKTNTLLVAQFDCAYDCPKDDKTAIWEITFK